jgi:DNA-binding CsgD family transcriptional regulator
VRDEYAERKPHTEKPLHSSKSLRVFKPDPELAVKPGNPVWSRPDSEADFLSLLFFPGLVRLHHKIVCFSGEYRSKLFKFSLEYLNMVFEVSAAKEEVLRKLTEQDWTPTELAEELDKSRSSVYNHLNDLHQRGILQKRNVEAKTRPKTEYSIGNGFVQYITVLPGQYTEKTLDLTDWKEALFRIWTVPQNEFHPFLENYWYALRNNKDLPNEDVEAVAVYGSVANGTADNDSDIDLLLITSNKETSQTADEQFGALRVDADGDSKICMTEVYSFKEYRDSVAHGSNFLEKTRGELHIIYDPDKILQQPLETGIQ